MISPRRLSGNEPHLACRGEPPGFPRLWQVLSTYDGDLRELLWWPQERPVPMRVARGALGLPLELDWYDGELVELQQGCVGPFGSSRG